MTSPEIIEENPIGMNELRQELEKNKKNLGELNFRAEKTMDYLNEFIKIKPKQAKELMEKLMALKIPRLREAHLHKIVDILPHKKELVKALFQGTPLTISEDNCKKIVKVVEEFRPEKAAKVEKVDSE